MREHAVRLLLLGPAARFWRHEAAAGLHLAGCGVGGVRSW